MYNIALEKSGVNFVADVGKQGTGIDNHGVVKTCASLRRVRAHHRRVVTQCTSLKTISALPTDSEGRSCESSKGEVIGGNSVCLLPGFMVAADPRCNNMGDILYIKDLKGLSLEIPGTTAVVEHPGYFMVEDTGGGIKGCDRFDFFAGKSQLEDNINPFGISSGSTLVDPKDCSRKYERIPFDPSPNSKWIQAYNRIHRVYDEVAYAKDRTVLKGSPALPDRGRR